MSKLPDKYDAKIIENKWRHDWQKNKIYQWKNDLPKNQTFVIDTPPPTVSGLLHMGHVFSYTQADFVARYNRMSGKDVFYPMGFDDNGLPTERLVEKIIGKKAGIYENENGRGSFVIKCREVVEEAEKEFEICCQKKYLTLTKFTKSFCYYDLASMSRVNEKASNFIPSES